LIDPKFNHGGYMNVGFQWAEPLMKAAAYQKLKTPNSFLEKIEQRLLILLDEIFAYLFASYQKQRILLINKITIIQPPKEKEITPNQIFQKKVLNVQDPNFREKIAEIRPPLLTPPRHHSPTIPKLDENEGIPGNVHHLEQDLKKQKPNDRKEDSVASDHCQNVQAKDQKKGDKEKLEILDEDLKDKDSSPKLRDSKSDKNPLVQPEEALDTLPHLVEPDLEEEKPTDRKEESDTSDSLQQPIAQAKNQKKADEEKLEVLHADIKKKDSSSKEKHPLVQQEEVMETLRVLVEDNMNEIEIINMMNESVGLAADHCKQLIAKIKEQRKKTDLEEEKPTDRKEKSVASDHCQQPIAQVKDQKKADEEKLEVLHEEIKKNDSTPKEKHPFEQQKEVMETLRVLVEDNMNEIEIINMMKESVGLAADHCKQLIAKINEQRKKTVQNDEVKLDVLNGSLDGKIKPTYPVLILSEKELNQYLTGGTAACTPLACQFLASEQSASPPMIADLIVTNNYKKDTFVDTEECIKNYHLRLAENPWEDQRAKSKSMQVSFKRNAKMGIAAAVKSILNEPKIRGAIITANGLTIGMRKHDRRVEFFDSHGDATLTNQGNAAYIQVFAHDQAEQITNFLVSRFPDIEWAPAIEIWPIA
jgi:hypothetical protein